MEDEQDSAKGSAEQAAGVAQPQEQAGREQEESQVMGAAPAAPWRRTTRTDSNERCNMLMCNKKWFEGAADENPTQTEAVWRSACTQGKTS